MAVLPEPLLLLYRMPVSWQTARPVAALYFLLSSYFLKLFGAMSFLDLFAATLLQTIVIQYAVITHGVSICNKVVEERQRCRPQCCWNTVFWEFS